jgi:hypothetical protein
MNNKALTMNNIQNVYKDTSFLDFFLTIEPISARICQFRALFREIWVLGKGGPDSCGTAHAPKPKVKTGIFWQECVHSHEGIVINGG